MENIELELQLANLKKEINDRLELQMELRQQLAELVCPFVIGDRVVDKQGIKAEVSKITWTSWSEGYKIRVRKIKKDGDLFINEIRVWDPVQWTKSGDEKR